MTGEPAPDLAARLEAVHQRIAAAGGDPAAIRLVAVTKGFGADAVRAALDLGLIDIGESYAQEMTAKTAELDDVPPPVEPRWHFIGRLQSNKVRKIAPFVSLWHSVDRLSLGAEIAHRAPGAAVLAQVDLTGEESKGGCPESRLHALIDGLTDLGLAVRGLMTIGPLGPAEDARPVFRKLRELADRYDLVDCSMGMSADLEVAVEEGSTIVRLGSALFGPRPRTAGVRH
ncbi:MAG TPA: YggS family pyridoxal phosphate-dependent enzyme [Acidimicrobiales bacterium]|nr:YggS family pyridoxal phosphate-dependent enzyme [Acidimicrobiales bacterium]